MGRGLARLASDVDATVVVATHSPAVLTEPLAHLVEVRRSELDGSVVASPLHISLSSRLARNAEDQDLGLPRPELLQLVRVAVAVEGLHEEIIFRSLLGRQLDAAGAWLLPMRGAKDLRHLVEAQLLFDFSSAAVLVVVDNVRGEIAVPIWRRAQAAAAADHRSAAHSALLDFLREKGWEAQWLCELGIRALETGQLERIDIFPMTQPDIICYLPVNAFLPDARDWGEVLTEWSRQPKPKLNLKDWLRAQGQPVDRRTVSQAVEQMGTVPDEIERLGARLLELGAFTNTPPP